MLASGVDQNLPSSPGFGDARKKTSARSSFGKGTVPRNVEPGSVVERDDNVNKKKKSFGDEDTSTLRSYGKKKKSRKSADADSQPGMNDEPTPRMDDYSNKKSKKSSKKKNQDAAAAREMVQTLKTAIAAINEELKIISISDTKGRRSLLARRESLDMHVIQLETLAARAPRQGDAARDWRGEPLQDIDAKKKKKKKRDSYSCLDDPQDSPSRESRRASAKVTIEKHPGPTSTKSSVNEIKARLEEEKAARKRGLSLPAADDGASNKVSAVMKALADLAPPEDFKPALTFKELQEQKKQRLAEKALKEKEKEKEAAAAKAKAEAEEKARKKAEAEKAAAERAAREASSDDYESSDGEDVMARIRQAEEAAAAAVLLIKNNRESPRGNEAGEGRDEQRNLATKRSVPVVEHAVPAAVPQIQMMSAVVNPKDTKGSMSFEAPPRKLSKVPPISMSKDNFDENVSNGDERSGSSPREKLQHTIEDRAAHHEPEMKYESKPKQEHSITSFADASPMPAVVLSPREREAGDAQRDYVNASAEALAKGKRLLDDAARLLLRSSELVEEVPDAQHDILQIRSQIRLQSNAIKEQEHLVEREIRRRLVESSKSTEDALHDHEKEGGGARSEQTLKLLEMVFNEVRAALCKKLVGQEQDAGADEFPPAPAAPLISKSPAGCGSPPAAAPQAAKSQAGSPPAADPETAKSRAGSPPVAAPQTGKLQAGSPPVAASQTGKLQAGFPPFAAPGAANGVKPETCSPVAVARPEGSQNESPSVFQSSVDSLASAGRVSEAPGLSAFAAPVAPMQGKRETRVAD